MKAAEFVTLSSKLVAMGSAGARIAVRRAYYGAFHTALEVLAEFDLAPAANGRAHMLARQFLQCSANEAARRAAGLLTDMYNERIKADYRLERHDVERTEYAKLSVERAIKLMERRLAFRDKCRADPLVLQEFRDQVTSLKSLLKVVD